MISKYTNAIANLVAKILGQKCTLETHTKFIHENRRYFSCDVCNKKFVTDSNLKRHLWEFHKVKSKATKIDRSTKLQVVEQK